MDPIKIDITILAPVEKVWNYFNEPKHITKWNLPMKAGIVLVLKMT
jgi:uncharacterized protein YndB with AHSA1/START domain